MKSKIIIEIEGVLFCHPEKEELEEIGKQLEWILQGKVCGDQELTIRIERGKDDKVNKNE